MLYKTHSLAVNTNIIKKLFRNKILFVFKYNINVIQISNNQIVSKKKKKKIFFFKNQMLYKKKRIVKMTQQFKK